MVQAGARPIDWKAVTSEWAPDYTGPEREKLGDVWSRRGSGVGLLIDYVFAQVTSRPCADAVLGCARHGGSWPGTDQRADENGRHTFRAKTRLPTQGQST